MAKAFLETELRAVGVDAAVKARALYEPADRVADEAVEVMRSYGLDIGSHVPTPIGDRDVDGADLILTMDSELLRGARSRWPDAAEKMHRIIEFATGEPSDVRDPMGDPSEYIVAAQRLEKAAVRIAARLAP